jgi:dihydroneopterin aldolase
MQYLQLDKITFSVNLGVPEAERIQKQEVHLWVKLFFPELPQACFTDNINDSICYDQFSNNIAEFIEGQMFSTIEHLTHQLYLNIKSFPSFNHEVKLWLKLEKPGHTTPAIQGSASFVYTDYDMLEWLQDGYPTLTHHDALVKAS